VIALDNAVSPSFVGYDIACRMTMTILDLSVEDFKQRRSEIGSQMRSVTAFGVGAVLKAMRYASIRSWRILFGIK